jgi:hypothetical protein
MPVDYPPHRRIADVRARIDRYLGFTEFVEAHEAAANLAEKERVLYLCQRLKDEHGQPPPRGWRGTLFDVLTLPEAAGHA